MFIAQYFNFIKSDRAPFYLKQSGHHNYTNYLSTDAFHIPTMNFQERFSIPKFKKILYFLYSFILKQETKK